MDVPNDVAQELAHAVGAYVRAMPATELPPALVPVKKTAQTAKGLARHRTRLVALTDDEVMRRRMLEWLEDDKPSLPKRQAEILRVACERPEGWLEHLTSMSAERKDETPAAPDTSGLERKLERLRAEERRAREGERRAREELKREVARLERDVQAARTEIAEARAEAAALAREAKEAAAASERAERDLDRERRRSRTAADKADEEREKLKAQLKEARDEVRALRRAVERLEAQKERAERSPAAAPPRSGPRPVLKPAKGRFDDDPETLSAWLRRDDVRLLVDGYNVTRHEAGFSHLSLEKQRERLLNLLKKLSSQHSVEVVLVWDGGEVPPATARKRHGNVRVEFSPPRRSEDDKDRADRHILELLDQMPPDPVIVVTNDGELRTAAAARRATLAASQQLLSLLR